MKQHPLEIQGRKSIVPAFLNKKEKQILLILSIVNLNLVWISELTKEGFSLRHPSFEFLVNKYLDSLLDDSCPQPSQEEKTKRFKSLLIISFHPGVVIRDHVDGAN